MQLATGFVLLTLLGLGNISEAKMGRGAGGGGASRFPRNTTELGGTILLGFWLISFVLASLDDAPYKGGLYTNYAYRPSFFSDSRNDDTSMDEGYGDEDVPVDDEPKPCIGLCYIMKLRKLEAMNQR